MADDKQGKPSSLTRTSNANLAAKRTTVMITKKGNPDDYYVKLRVFNARKVMLWLTVGLLAFFEAGIIFNVMLYDISWLTILTPLIIISSITLLFPPTEEWLYRPWQAEAQRVERHFYDV